MIYFVLDIIQDVRFLFCHCKIRFLMNHPEYICSKVLPLYNMFVFFQNTWASLPFSFLAGQLKEVSCLVDMQISCHLFTRKGVCVNKENLERIFLSHAFLILFILLYILNAVIHLFILRCSLSNNLLLFNPLIRLVGHSVFSSCISMSICSSW